MFGIILYVANSFYYLIIIIVLNKNLNKRISVQEKETIRNNVKKMIVKNPTLERTKIVSHFVSEGYVRSTIYNTLDRLSNSSSIKSNKRYGRDSYWTSAKLMRRKQQN